MKCLFLKKYSPPKNVDPYFQLQHKRIHMAIGGLSPLLPQKNLFSFSYAHHSSPYVFVVRAGVFFQGVEQLLYPMETKAWLALLVQFSITIVFIELTERFANPYWRDFIFGSHSKFPIRNLFVTLMGNPLPTPCVPKRNFARYLLMAWLLWTFELRNFYQGKMFDSLRLAKRRPTPATIKELIDQDYTFLTNFYRDFYPQNKSLIVPKEVERLDILAASTMRLTSTATIDYMANYNMENWKTTTLTYVDETIYLYQCVIFFPKNSILLPSFNRKFKLLLNAGITSYMAQRHIHPYFRNIKSSIPGDDVGSITHKNLVGLYYIYVAMCGWSIIAFILEMATKKSKILKCFIDYFN